MELATTEQGSKPVYKYSINLDNIVLGWTFALLLATAFYVVYSGIANLLDVVWVGLLEIILLYDIVLRWRLPVKAAKFYEERASIHRPDSQEEFSYSDIKQISLTRSFWTGRKISIFLRTRDKPLVLIKNPRNPASKLDLYSWLLSRTNQARGQD